MFEDIITSAKSESEQLRKAHEKEIRSDMDMDSNRSIKIAVIGVGGAGSNCITRMVKAGLKSANTIAINTDSNHLSITEAHKKILIGKKITKGLGAGGDSSIGEKCASADSEMLKKEIGENELVFLVGGMGGGTGTGAMPIIAKLAKENGAVIIAMVTYPFNIERSRIKTAQNGIRTLLEVADTVVVIDNNRLLSYAPNLPVNKAFELADSITSNAVIGISDTIMFPSLINVDYADVKAIMQNGGVAFISLGKGSGHDRVDKVIQDTLEHPLLDIDYEDAKGALLHLEGGTDLTLGETIRIGEGITANFNENVNVKIGARVNPELQGAVRATAIIVGVKSPMILEGQGKTEATTDLDNERLSKL